MKIRKKMIYLVLITFSFTVRATDCIGDYQIQRNQDANCMEKIKLVEIEYFNNYKAIINQYEMDKFDAQIERQNFQNPRIHEVFYQPIYGISFDNISDEGGYASGSIHYSSIRFVKEYNNSNGNSVDEIKDMSCFRDGLIYNYSKVTHPFWFLAEKERIDLRCEYDRVNAE
mgnify:CR=1 FL=1|tara:strand:+ start:89320 stop:89832 length:513 start_codon:yes stop_codon:yes gene_type:complete